MLRLEPRVDPDSAADDPTTKDTKVAKDDTDNQESENGSRGIDSAPEEAWRGIP